MCKCEGIVLKINKLLPVCKISTFATPYYKKINQDLNLIVAVVDFISILYNYYKCMYFCYICMVNMFIVFVFAGYYIKHVGIFSTITSYIVQCHSEDKHISKELIK